MSLLLLLKGTAAGTTATPGTASLTLSTFAPVVSTPVLVTPGTANLTTSTFAPTVSTPRLVVPGVASLSLSTFAPTVSAGGSATVVPGTVALVLTTFAPAVQGDIADTRGHIALADVARWGLVTTNAARYGLAIDDELSP